MVTKTCSGSERVRRNSGAYFVSERACQGGFSSHPEGMALPAYRFVEALDRWTRTALHASPRAASGRSHVPALADNEFGP
jgi:hypothetical protein